MRAKRCRLTHRWTAPGGASAAINGDSGFTGSPDSGFRIVDPDPRFRIPGYRIPDLPIAKFRCPRFRKTFPSGGWAGESENPQYVGGAGILRRIAVLDDVVVTG